MIVWSWPIKADVLYNNVRNCVFLKTITSRSSCFVTGGQELVRATPLNGPMYHNETKGRATHCDAAHLQWGIPKLGGRCWEGRCWEGRCQFP